MRKLREWAERRGYKLAVGSSRAVADAARFISSLRGSGQLSEEFYRNNLSWVDEGSPGDTYSLVMIAAPRPAHTIDFSWQGTARRAVLPVTYHGYRQFFAAVCDDLNDEWSDTGIRFSVLPAPLKSLAARMGLVRYGRNNITYCDGMGSFHQLVALRASAPLADADGGISVPEPLPRCRDCRACRVSCPGGAIAPTRFLISADRCLTLASEYPGPLPPGMRRRRTPCLIGCLDCQTCCPENKGKLRFSDTGIVFSEAETRDILRSESAGWASVGESAREKIERLRIIDLDLVAGRNLRVLLESMPAGAPSG